MPKPHLGLITTDGQLIIGSTALNAGGTHLNIGNITSTGGTITVTNGAGTINIEAGAAVATTYISDSGSTTPVANMLSLLGGTGISTAVGPAGTITFSVDGAVVGETITGDSGGALSPTAGNWNVLGLSGSKTSGSGSSLTVKSPPFSQVGSSATSSLNTGEFVTAAVTRTLPASAGLADGDLFIYVCTTAGALVIQSVGAQKIRVGSTISAAAGTATSTAIGDSLTLRFNATDGFFYAVSSVGNWLVV